MEAVKLVIPPFKECVAMGERGLMEEGALHQ